jgi:hypothetical protein
VYHSLKNHAVEEIGMAKKSVFCDRMGEMSSAFIFPNDKAAGA